MNLEWLSIKEYVPPFNVMVVIKNENDVVSVGRIVEIRTVVSETDRSIRIASYEWSSVEPFIRNPTHWMHFPKK